MVEIASILVEPVLGHELDDLQGALGARDIRQGDVGLQRSFHFGGVREQSIGQHRHLDRVLDRRGYRLWTFGAVPSHHLRIGRKAYGLLRRLGLTNITIDYVVVDPLRVPRSTFAAIFTAWRDGYADTVSEHAHIPRDRFVAHFDEMIATIEDPGFYAVWQVPVVAGRVR